MRVACARLVKPWAFPAHKIEIGGPQMKLRYQTYQFMPAIILVYSLLPVLAEAQFIQQAKLVGTGAIGAADQGSSVSLSADGNTVIIGGPRDNTGMLDNAGAAWVFVRSRGHWTQQAKLVGAGAIGNADQGNSVSLSSDGDTAIVGGPQDNNLAGAAWVFQRSGRVWRQQAKLVPKDTSFAHFGWSVSLSGDGNTAIVGGPDSNGFVGAAWVFQRSGRVWRQQAKLIGTGVTGAVATQGTSVALSRDGNTAIVGGSGDNDSVGAAWVFTQSCGVWTQQAKLVGSGAVGMAAEGESVSLSQDGNTAIIGGPADSPPGLGAAWVFERSGGVWTQQGSKLVGTGAIADPAVFQGSSVSLSDNGSTALVSGWPDNNNTGATWVFERSGGVWTQQGSKLVGTGAIGEALQGTSVSLSGDGNIAVIGGPFDDSQTGAVWVFSQEPAFAGTPGSSNCQGQSVSALAKQYGGLSNAAAALGFDSVSALQNAVGEFCGG
jgi:FG-GAP repeat